MPLPQGTTHINTPQQLSTRSTHHNHPSIYQQTIPHQRPTTITPIPLPKPPHLTTTTTRGSTSCATTPPSHHKPTSTQPPQTTIHYHNAPNSTTAKSPIHSTTPTT
nr:putative uncharacterized protein YHR217C [Penaeus vannamei]